MKIKNYDVLWSYSATFLKIGSSVFLLPVILSNFSSGDVALWSIFMGITSLTNLLDMGFNSSFVRNVSLVYSGVNKLSSDGIENISIRQNINFNLLNDLIHSMKWYYLRIAILLFLLIGTFGTVYINSVLTSYTGNLNEVWVSWCILCVMSAFTFYSQYLEVLLLGKGEVMKSKKIIVFGQILYLSLCFLFIAFKFGIISVILSQFFSVIVIRYLTHYYFYKKEFQNLTSEVNIGRNKEILKAIYPNALKLGITSIGAFLVQRASLFMGTFFLPLEVVASYGVTVMIINVLSVLSVTYINTYTPKIVHLRVTNDTKQIAQIYIIGKLIMFLFFLIGGVIIIYFGPYFFSLINSNTHLLSRRFIILLLIFSLLENNHGIAGGILLTKNKVPFYKASLIAGILTVFFVFVFNRFTSIGIWGIILGPGIAQFYQNWKWPREVARDLMINRQMFFHVVKGWKFDFLKF